MGNTCVSRDKHDLGNIHLHFEHGLDQKNKDIPQAINIKLLSYNIFIRPPGINSNGNDYKDERLSEFLKAIHSYDVVCLQEMFGAYSSRQKEFIQRAKDLGFLYKAISPKQSTFSEHFIDGGLLVLSRYPIQTIEFLTFPVGIRSDYYSKKGVLYTKIKVGNSRLHLFTTHAQATYDANEEFFVVRTQQFAALQEFMVKMLNQHIFRDGDLALIAGDFNVDGRSVRRYEARRLALNPAFGRYKSLMKTEDYSEYDGLMAALSNDGRDKVEDLICQNKGEHPITYGDFYTDNQGKKVPIEKVLTDVSCWCVGESLDYIFNYVPTQITQGAQSGQPGQVNQSQSPTEAYSSQKPGLSIVRDSAEVQPFLIHGYPFEQLSDHYGVHVTLQYTKIPETHLSYANYNSNAVQSLQGATRPQQL